MNAPRYEFSQLLGIGMTIIIFGIAIAYGLDIMDDTRGTFCDGTGENYYNSLCYTCDTSGNSTFESSNLTCGNASSGYTELAGQNNGMALNATTDSITGVSKIPEKLPTIVTIVVAAVIIGILVRYLWIKQ